MSNQKCVDCGRPARAIWKGPGLVTPKCECVKCTNCGEKLKNNGHHFVPPSLGEPGFFICKDTPND